MTSENKKKRFTLAGCLGTAFIMSSVPALGGNAFTTDYLTEEVQQLITGARQPPPGEEQDHWYRFSFSKEGPEFGDVAVAPFADGTEYKINGLNYDLYLGQDFKIPFQVYYGDLSSSEQPEASNEAELQDATQGLAIQFPIAWIYTGKEGGGVCNFKNTEGYCVLGADVTARNVRLNALNEQGAIEEKSVFGASAALRASLLFPVRPSGDQSDVVGKLGLSAGLRYFWHDSENENLLFGDLTDPDGSPVTFDGSFSLFSLESELEIFSSLKLRLEYFRPLSSNDILDDVVKFSFVVANDPN